LAWDEVTAMEVRGRIARANPDLLLPDYQMPGCNGLALARTARRAKPELPVLVLTATLDPGIMKAPKSRALSRILHKPLR
jgi:CheY-like chemotaxis protein